MEILAENRKARFDYEILEKYEAGMELTGMEAKAIRSGKCTMLGSFAKILGGEAYLVGASISPYQPANTPKDYDPLRARKLLLTKKELEELKAKEKVKGLTIVPVILYNKNGKIKLEVAVVRGKKSHDKRETIKKRDTDRETRRELKDR